MDEGLVSFGSDQKPTKKINKAIGIVLDSFGEFGESHIIDQNVFEKDLQAVGGGFTEVGGERGKGSKKLLKDLILDCSVEDVTFDKLKIFLKEWSRKKGHNLKDGFLKPLVKEKDGNYSKRNESVANELMSQYKDKLLN